MTNEERYRAALERIVKRVHEYDRHGEVNRECQDIAREALRGATAQPTVAPSDAADARRYRFLRDQYGMGNIFMHTRTCDLDAVIDAEIQRDADQT